MAALRLRNLAVALAAALFCLAIWKVLPARAQNDETADRSYLVGLLEDQLSTPNRQFRINNIQGALSSDATIGEITIADREGVWLRISNARIVWTRSALLLGRLEIASLGAERIDVLRRSLPDEGAPAPEAGGGFLVPELPVSVNLEALVVQHVAFDQSVFGLKSEIAATGRLSLADGSLDTQLNVRRLDGPGGELGLTAAFANASRILTLDLKLDEPANGVVANLLNVEGRPPMSLALQGQGPLAELDLNLTLDADQQRILTGVTQLRREGDLLNFTTRVEGPLQRLIAPVYRDFFGAQSMLALEGRLHDRGGLEISSLDLSGGALTLKGSASTTADGFLKKLLVDAEIADANAARVVLPVAGGETTVQRAALKLNFGGNADGRWTGDVLVNDLTTGAFSASSLDLVFQGLAENLDNPTQRRVTFGASGGLSGIVSKRADVAEALGDHIALGIDGEWSAGQPINLTKAEMAGNGISAHMVGTIAEAVFRGTIDLAARSIAPFSAIASRDLKGALKLTAEGSVSALGGGFDLVLDGGGDGLGVGTPAADALLAGKTRISGRLARGEQGIVAEGLRIENEQFAAAANGRVASDATDFTFNAALADLALLSQSATGRATAQGRAVGNNGVINLTLDASLPSGEAAGRALRDASARFDGVLRGDKLDGSLGGDAFLGGERVTLEGEVAVTDELRSLTDLKFSAGGARLSGDVAQNRAGLFEGALSLDAPDISVAAALLLRKATGSAKAGVKFGDSAGKQSLSLNASATDLIVDDVRVGQAQLEAEIADLFNVPIVDGKFSASDVAAGGVSVATMEGTAAHRADATVFATNAALTNQTRFATMGVLAPENGGYRVRLDDLELRQGALKARLVEPASVLVNGSNLKIDSFVADVGGGRIEMSGSLAEALDLNVVLRAVPLALANAVKPELGLGGTVDATASIGGTRKAPQAQFQISGRSIGAQQLRAAGLSTLTIDARGSSTASRLDVDASTASPEGLRATARGTIPLDDGALDLAVDLKAFPLGALNAVASGQDLAGNVSGSARIGGNLQAPTATFDMAASSVRAAPLVSAGLAPLTIGANGRLSGDVVQLASVQVDGHQGFKLTARGAVPLSGPGLDVSVNGQAPLSLANRFLMDRGTQASGTLSLSGNVSGSVQSPVVNGMFSTTGAQIIDPETNVRLRDINLMAVVDGDRVTLRSASAALGSGGAINASGSIATNAAAGFPADLRINLNRARYADGNMLVATVDGAFTLAGPLARDPVLAGDIDVLRAEIAVPDMAGAAAALDVKHKDAPAAVRETLRRAKANDGTPTPTARPSILRLNVRVKATNQIFVRGRGLDAELGGAVTLAGAVNDIQPVGGFRLVRGRLSILGQRITFDEGEVTLVGDLDPFLDFVARSEGDDITVFINVRGRVSALDVTFSSQPQLPQDEVLARLIFKRGINELSPLQIAQLAAAAAELAGGANSSLLGSLRGATGLDDIDVVTDSEGNAAVRAGRYINDNIYLGVEAGSGGTTRGTINLDITDDLKAKGSVGSNGDSSVGIFFEKDY
jgi:translocation and assembly module TamB